MKLSNEAYENIKQAVADMLVDYNIKGVPINAFEVAIKIGLTVIPYSALSASKRKESLRYSVDGYSVEGLDGSWTIYYNDFRKDFSRINQTIMHEVGHYILGHTKEGPQEEAEAKFFAKYTLASPPLLHNMKAARTVENVMNSFAIGYQAANIALDNYQSWLIYGPIEYVAYERKILCQLEIDISTA